MKAESGISKNQYFLISLYGKTHYTNSFQQNRARKNGYFTIQKSVVKYGCLTYTTLMDL